MNIKAEITVRVEVVIRDDRKPEAATPPSNPSPSGRVEIVMKNEQQPGSLLGPLSDDEIAKLGRSVIEKIFGPRGT